MVRSREADASAYKNGRATRAPRGNVECATPKTRTRRGASTSEAPRKPQSFKLRLYVAGQTPKSIRAFANLKVLCEEHLKGRYQIEVIDLLEHPHMARGDQIVARADAGDQASAGGPQDHRRPVQHRSGAGGPGPARARLTRKIS